MGGNIDLQLFHTRADIRTLEFQTVECEVVYVHKTNCKTVHVLCRKLAAVVSAVPSSKEAT